MDLADYPQHQRLEQIPEEHRDAIAFFIEWLDSNGYMICRWLDAGNNGQPRRIPVMPEQLKQIRVEQGVLASVEAEMTGIENPEYHAWAAGWVPVHVNPQSWLAEYLGIDLKAFHLEKQRMYEREVRQPKAQKQEESDGD